MNKKIVTIVIIIIALILLFPIPMRLKDGGSIRFQALLYSVTKYHKLDHNAEDGYVDGIGIEILGMEVYNSTEKTNNNINEGKQQLNATEKVIIGHDKITNMILLDNFLDNTNQYNKEKSSCRVEIVTYTIEGDEIITTLEYNKENNEFIVTKDNTKDEFATEKDRKVETKKYSNDTYNLEKRIKNNNIHLVLVDKENEINICVYDKELEENKDTNKTKIKDAKLKAEATSTEELVYYNGILYGEAYVRIDYMPNPEGPIGTINKLIGKDYLPQLNGETNAESLLNAKVDSANEKSMILIVDNIGVLFNAIESSNHSFFAKIVESNAKNIIVEPVEDSLERKTSDKFLIKLGDTNDEIYPIGTNVKITYDGEFKDSYPVTINPIKIEIKSTDNFELIFHQRKDMGIKTIVANEETDKYSYNIFSKGGDFEIKIDGVVYDLREALLSDKTTMEEIIQKANKDIPNAISYDDGGSMEYHYEDYTIIKYHTLDGNRDVYMGMKGISLNDIQFVDEN